MIIINRTPHAIALVGDDGVTRIIEKTGSPVRIETTPTAQVDTVSGVRSTLPRSRFLVL